MAVATTGKHRYGQRMKSLFVERLYPFVAAGGTGAASWWLDLDMEPNSSQLLTATVTFGAIASGFVATSLSILTSLDTPVMQKIRATRYRVILQEYLGWALVAGIALSLTGIGGLFLDVACEPLFVSTWCLALAFCICCLWRLGTTMLQVFGDRENLARRK